MCVFDFYFSKIGKFFTYSKGSEFVTATVSVPYRTVYVPCLYRTVPHRVLTVVRFFTVSFFTASATVTVPFFSLTVRSAKRTEPLILTVRF